MRAVCDSVGAAPAFSTSGSGYASPIAPSAVHLAQLNIGLAKEPVDSPLLAEFVAALDPINALADDAPGFVWRLQTDDGNATSIRVFEDERMILNMSVWESVQDVMQFVYRSGHVEVMRRRREWFERVPTHMALWWVPAGHLPSVEEALTRLAHLRAHGPTPYAFTFKAHFPAQAVGHDDSDSLLLIDEQIGCSA